MTTVAAAAAAPPPAPPPLASVHSGLALAREACLQARYPGITCVGIDEAGRGPLAGPVVAAAVAVLPGGDGGVPVAGVRDSKIVPEEEREALFAALSASPRVVIGVEVVSRAVIDDVNILQATMRGMEAAFASVRAQLAARAAAGGNLYALVDGPKVPAAIAASVEAHCAGRERAPRAVQFAEPVIGGDAKVYSIAAASLIAKVTRDRLMRAADAVYPHYGFAVHKGYGVPAHVAAIYKHGPCDIHRRTFNPVKSMLLAAARGGTDEAPPAAASSKAAAVVAAAASAPAAAKRARTPPPPPPPPPAVAAAGARTAVAGGVVAGGGSKRAKRAR